MQMTPTFRDIEQAAQTLKGLIAETPTIYSHTFSKLFESDVYLKLENLQKTSSFKVRGSGVKIVSLPEDQRKKGIICASAGNHAQGVAFHAQALGIPATIVMSELTPFVKISATKAFGANVIVRGKTFDDAYEFAQQYATEHHLTFIHPFNDFHVIAGQGTVGLEIFNQVKDLDYVIVPIGGGGLISGVSLAIKSLSPKTKIIGVQTESAPNAHHLFYGQEKVSLKSTIAEGIAAKTPGDLCMSIIKEHVEDILIVKEDTIERAINKIQAQQKLVVEGSAAASIACLMENTQRFAGKKVCAILSGGNIDTRTLTSIMMRGLIRGGQLVKIHVETADVVGTIANISEIISKSRANIIEFHHQRLFYMGPLKSTNIEIALEVENLQRAHGIVDDLNESGYKTNIVPPQ